MGPQIELTLRLCWFLAVALSPLMGAYPERPIKVIIHMLPGGGTDTIAWLVFRRAQELTDARFYIENHLGAGGQIGYKTLARSEPDGHTIGAITIFSVVTHELTRTGVAYSLKGSFQPIARIVHDPVALVVRADSAFQTLHELVEAAKSARREHTWGVTSVWGAHHIHYELFQQATGVRLKTVPFDGGAAPRAALLGGHIDVCSGGFSEYAFLLRAGRVRVLVIGAPERWDAFPETPTYRDARKTRFQPARYGFGRTGLSPASNRQLCLAHACVGCDCHTLPPFGHLIDFEVGPRLGTPVLDPMLDIGCWSQIARVPAVGLSAMTALATQVTDDEKHRNMQEHSHA